ncbi:MAG: hypothetical protein IPH45_03480 [Bacteroidales bacterium]|nr:hypothetical protein [Bacteroidales bacterium]
MGRINAIAFHPTDVNTIYIGAPSGGIWKTTDGGASWVNLANNLPKLGVSSILVHPADPNIIYIGTGDRDASDAPGIGVFKTVDGGTTWVQINNTMGNKVVGDMLMHPSDPNTILAATNGGIYKTTNGGATWTLKSGAYNFKDIQFKPGDPSVVYGVRITTPSRFYRSTNTGDTWTQITSGLPTTDIGSRMVIGTSPLILPVCIWFRLNRLMVHLRIYCDQQMPVLHFQRCRVRRISLITVAMEVEPQARLHTTSASM